MTTQITSLTNTAVNVVIFDEDKYPNAQADFAKAVEAGDVNVLEVDEDSYTMFYNIQNSVYQTAELLGKKVHLGVCKEDMFISIDEMDGFASEMDSDYEPYGSRQQAFVEGLAYRKMKEQEQEALEK
jgi:hypothetical protein